MRHVSDILLQHASSEHQDNYDVLIGDGKTYEHVSLPSKVTQDTYATCNCAYVLVEVRDTCNRLKTTPALLCKLFSL